MDEHDCAIRFSVGSQARRHPAREFIFNPAPDFIAHGLGRVCSRHPIFKLQRKILMCAGDHDSPGFFDERPNSELRERLAVTRIAQPFDAVHFGRCSLFGHHVDDSDPARRPNNSHHFADNDARFGNLV